MGMCLGLEHRPLRVRGLQRFPHRSDRAPDTTGRKMAVIRRLAAVAPVGKRASNAKSGKISSTQPNAEVSVYNPSFDETSLDAEASLDTADSNREFM